MRNAFRKDITREIKNTFGRFAAIFAIVALGVAFFAGIGSTGLDMKLTGDSYFSARNMMDIRVLSTYGLNNNDVAAIAGVDGVKSVYPAYNTDALVDVNGKGANVKVHSLMIDGTAGIGRTAGIDGVNVNAPSLVAGRMPLAANEAVAESRFASRLSLGVGDMFTLTSGKKTDMRDTLKNVRFRLVGLVNSPYYFSNAERGASSIGNGSTDCYLLIPDTNFRQGVYSEAFVTLEGAEGLAGFSKEYEELADAVVRRVEDAGKEREVLRYVEMTERAYDSVAMGERELAEARANASDGLVFAREEIIGARRSLERARQSLLKERTDVFAGMMELDTARLSLSAGLSALDGAAEDALSSAVELAHTCSSVLDALAELELGGTGFAEMESAIRAMYMDNPTKLVAGISGLSDARAQIGAARAELSESYGSAALGESAARDAHGRLIVERDALNARLEGLSEDSDALSGGAIEINVAYTEISRSLNELDRRLAELEESELEQARQFETTGAALAASRKALNDMEYPEWYVSDRDANAGHSGFVGDADKIEAIGRVFPVIFYVVAALVSLTTMTRLVEERRTEIGTLKALGYGNMKIMSKYIFYAAVPTLLGGIIGGLFGMSFFPGIIITLYGSLYTVPDPITIINFGYWGVGVGIAVVATLAATVSACLGELNASPAALLRPKPPKLGARIFLEYVPFLWKSLSFIRKVTLRNIIRYKKRFFMTVTGIAGCTALLMTGFGLRDSISSMITLQYGEINTYDMTVSFSDTAKQSDVNAAANSILSGESSRGIIKLRQKKYDVSAGGPVVSVSLIVPSDTDSFYDFTMLRDRVTHEKIPISADGAVITEKLSSLLAVGVGDALYLNDDGVRRNVTVTGICENYAEHYMYMPPALYEGLFLEEPDYNAIYVSTNDDADDDAVQRLANSTLEKKGVAAVFFTSTILGTFNRIVNSLNLVVVILIASAAALAVVVLLNLTSINISERKRELATIEVLGFYDREVSQYIFRENFVLTVIGVIAGLWLGIFLHMFVIVTAETDTMMFARKILPMSFVYSALLTFVFSSGVNMITGRRLKKINMVEALKSVE